MLRRLALAAVLALILLPASAADYRIDTVVDDLEHPWSLAWLPDGRMLVTERAGRLRVIEDGNLLEAPIHGVPPAYVAAQAGLFEVLPAPDFAESGWLYLSLAQGSDAANRLVVVRGRLQDHALTAVEEIFRAPSSQSTAVHYGGRMLFLPDGTLLVTLGDGFDHRERAQHLSDHFGTIIRIHPDGTASPDNPFADRAEALPQIWSYGHRNVQGIVHDAATGTVWAHEHGPRGGDELNRIVPGGNYGWPLATDGLDYTGARISPYRQLPGMQSPLRVWTPAIAPAGLALYRGALFADWDGDLLIAGLVSRAVHRIRVEDGAIRGESLHFTEPARRLRDVRVGPDGAIYLLTDHADGELLRVRPAP